MFQLHIKDTELFDEANETFILVKGKTLQLEHSLISLSKWEAKWKKPFLTREPKTAEEMMSYIECMTITQNVDPIVYTTITADQIEAIHKYLEDPMTATRIKEREGKGKSSKIVTNEEIYYSMIQYGIPFDPCQKWNLNHLLMLIRVCDEKQRPKKKMSRSELHRSNHSLNEARKAKYHTRG